MIEKVFVEFSVDTDDYDPTIAIPDTDVKARAIVRAALRGETDIPTPWRFVTKETL